MQAAVQFATKNADKRVECKTWIYLLAGRNYSRKVPCADQLRVLCKRKVAGRNDVAATDFNGPPSMISTKPRSKMLSVKEVREN